MKIVDIIEHTVFFVETDERGYHLYKRYSKDYWTMWAGERDEPAHECEDLEKAFQENVKKFI